MNDNFFISVSARVILKDGKRGTERFLKRLQEAVK